jgi:hypothetical protein
MFQIRRPSGRIFYLVLWWVIAASGMRLHAAPQSGPALTSVVDTVYRADGSFAQGVLVITWPAFVAADGTAVAAGSLDVTLGANGALNVALATNAGAAPAGVYYSVVYQLQPSEVRTEYWVVPATSPATLAQVRTTPGSGTAAQPVSMQYVNSALAAKANDNAVVHLAGTETVNGTKSFSTPPNVPTPVGTGDVTNKAYVDGAIATVGAGNYLPTAGGAMTGALSCPQAVRGFIVGLKGESGERVGADERVGEWNGLGAELFAGKRDVGVLRIERERDRDSKCSGGIDRACKRAGAGIFLGDGAVCAFDTERRQRGRVGESGGQPEHRAAGRHRIFDEQSQQYHLRRAQRQLVAESQRDD